MIVYSLCARTGNKSLEACDCRSSAHRLLNEAITEQYRLEQILQFNADVAQLCLVPPSAVEY